MEVDYDGTFDSSSSLTQVASRRHRVPNQNIVHQLVKRQTTNCKPGAQLHALRLFYQCVYPNCTLINVDKPPCFLRKFSLDGRYFIAFSASQHAVEIYKFNGSSAIHSLLQDIEDEETINLANFPLRSNKDVFRTMFTLRHTVDCVPQGQLLNRECSLFTSDNRYLIVGSCERANEDGLTGYNNVYANNESLTPNPTHGLEHYTLILVDIESGLTSHTKRFDCDKIFLSHNQGLYLYNDLLAVLSVQHQTIFLYRVDSHFHHLRTIGRFCYPDDANQVSAYHQPEVNYGPAVREPIINALKHRLLTYLWERSERVGTAESRRKFFYNFDNILKLRMWKMQLLDEDHLLIKYASEDIVTLKVTEPNLSLHIFVVYSISTATVISVFENTSEELLEYLETFGDWFRYTGGPVSTSSTMWTKQNQKRVKQSIINAKYGGKQEATKTILAQLPIACQSYSSSPYLDLGLYSYDCKWVSVMERPKWCSDHPIRFFSRQSGLLKFKIHTGLSQRNQSNAVQSQPRKLVAFIFHPSEPFAISVQRIQRTNSEYIVNFHVHHRYTGGSQERTSDFTGVPDVTRTNRKRPRII